MMQDCTKASYNFQAIYPKQFAAASSRWIKSEALELYQDTVNASMPSTRNRRSEDTFDCVSTWGLGMRDTVITERPKNIYNR